MKINNKEKLKKIILEENRNQIIENCFLTEEEFSVTLPIPSDYDFIDRKCCGIYWFKSEKCICELKKE